MYGLWSYFIQYWIRVCQILESDNSTCAALRSNLSDGWAFCFKHMKSKCEGWRPPGAQSAFIKWTGWTLAITMSWWQHHKHCPGYYYYYYYYCYGTFRLHLSFCDLLFWRYCTLYANMWTFDITISGIFANTVPSSFSIYLKGETCRMFRIYGGSLLLVLELQFSCLVVLFFCKIPITHSLIVEKCNWSQNVLENYMLW